MVKRTVNEIFRKTYNLHATKDEQSRKTFSQHKTWAALQSDPLFKNSLHRRKSQNHRDRMAAISVNEPHNRRSFTTNNHKRKQHFRKKRTQSQRTMDSNDSNDEDQVYDQEDEQLHQRFDRGETSSAFQLLSKKERHLMMKIMRADDKIKQNNNKL